MVEEISFICEKIRDPYPGRFLLVFMSSRSEPFLAFNLSENRRGQLREKILYSVKKILKVPAYESVHFPFYHSFLHSCFAVFLACGESDPCVSFASSICVVFLYLSFVFSSLDRSPLTSNSIFSMLAHCCEYRE